MISIIIPHYNSWLKLEELLSTIPRDPLFEIIVVDDKSDNPNKMTEMKTSFPNVFFFRNESGNKGAGAARNIGLKHATGEWLMFADADDMFTPVLMEKVKQYFKSKYDVIYFNPSSFNDRAGEVSTRHIQYSRLVTNYLNNPTKANELKLRFEFLVPWSKLIRKSVVDENDIQFEEIMQSNDILFSAKVGYYAMSIAVDKEIIYSVRESEGSLTSSITETSFRNRHKAWLDYVAFLKNKLTLKEFNKLRISSIQMLAKVYENKLGFSNYMYVIKNSIRHQIPLFDNRIFNIRLMIKQFREKRNN